MPANLSPCGAPLLARYDLDRVRVAVTREEIAARPRGLWRWAELLPVRDPAHRATLVVLNTGSPLVQPELLP